MIDSENLSRLSEPTGRFLFYTIVLALALLPTSCRMPGSQQNAPIAASATPKRVADTIEAPLRIATSGDYRPFSVWPPGSAEPRGFSIAVAQAYAKDRGVAIEWVRVRWPELAGDLAADRFDLALSGITIRPDRVILGRFSVPLTTSGAVLLVPGSSLYETATELNHESVRLAVNAGGHLERVARALFPAATIDAIPDNAAVLGRLAVQPEQLAADAVVSDSLEAPLWQASRPDLRAIGPLTRDNKAAWFPPSRRAEARRFDAWLLRAEASGELGRVRRRYALPDERTAQPVAALLASLDERLSLMKRVAQTKRLSGAPVEDRLRELRVLAAARSATVAAAARAHRAAPDREALDAFFGAQIEAAKWIQRRTLAEPASPQEWPDQDLETGREELEQRIRPALLYLGDRIAWLIVESTAAGDASPSEQEVAHALERHALPQSILRELTESLRQILRDGTRTGRMRRPRPARTGRAASG
ncbi:MAG: ABC transporter substrate-binding protein [Deltaproteobacteria bacterium]|nr:ABC transporter substrate-binding protein [Deltaproteobacteria bacterium]